MDEDVDKALKEITPKEPLLPFPLTGNDEAHGGGKCGRRATYNSVAMSRTRKQSIKDIVNFSKKQRFCIISY